MAQNLTAVFKITDQYTTAMQKIIQSQKTFEQKQILADRATENFSKRLGEVKVEADKGASGVTLLTGKLMGLVSAAYLAKKALDLTFEGINTAALQKTQEITFQALLNSKEAGSYLYKYVGEYAKISALDRESTAKGVTTFLSFTRDINQIEQLIKMTERLYAKDPTQGAEGAVFALKEALEGDVISLRNRFGISGLSGEKLRASDTTGKIEQIDSVLNRFGATQEVVNANYNNLNIQTEMFTSNLKTAIGENATPVMENLAEVMARVNENMQAGKYQPFINLMVNGMSMVGRTMAFVADNANWLIPTLAGVVTALIACRTATLLMDTAMLITGVTISAVTGNWIKLGAVIAGVAATAYMASKSLNDSANGFDVNLDEAKDLTGKALAGTDIPVEITNTDPVKVTGEVEIEKENLKYWLDMAGKKFFAEFNANTVTPSVNFYGTQVSEKVDVEEMSGLIGDFVYESAQIQPQGVY